jgi:hypothetical protein
MMMNSPRQAWRWPVLYCLMQTLPFLISPVLSFPVNRRESPVAFEQSQDAWASVIANVAPLMALVGERNAKEYMRTISHWHQLLPLCCAPVGILTILVSAVRLSGPGLLRRLVGCDCDRRSEVLVEVTPLSVRPATSAYTPQAVEIEPIHNRDAVAFICGHVKSMPGIDAIQAFRDILRYHQGSYLDDKDMEAVLVLRATFRPLKQVIALVDFIASKDNQDASLKLSSWLSKATASLSYRTTGISPTQREVSFLGSIIGLRNVCTSLMMLGFITGIQVLGAKEAGFEATRATLIMGVVGYLCMVSFTFVLLSMVQGETTAEKHVLSEAFNNAVWTFSNTRHSEHQRMATPAANTLITAPLQDFSTRQRTLRGISATVLTGCLIGSFVIYYLAMRVAPWWVSLSSLAVTWVGALYRAITSPTPIKASAETLDSEEHWIGMFRHTFNESLTATLNGAAKRTFDMAVITTPSLEAHDAPENNKCGGSTKTFPAEFKQYSVVLLVREPVRTTLGTWSGAEDVVKVGLEMAKIACRERVIAFPHHLYTDKGSKWLGIVRIRLAIYVPGLVWQSSHYLDWVLSPEFTMGDVIRYLLKFIHVCMDQPGVVSMHAVEEETAAKLSHVLCGPITTPPMRVDIADRRATLRDVLQALHNNRERKAEGHPIRRSSLEQALLLPTAIIACVYDRCMFKSGSASAGAQIQSLQDNFLDKLRLSGAEHLSTMQTNLSSWACGISF